MNKKYIYILIILLATIAIFSTSVTAFTIQKADKNTVTYLNNKSIITTSIVSTNFISDSKMKKDLDSIDKILIKVNNKTVNTIKKDKSWNKNKYYPTAIINRKTIVNGNIKGKTVSILTYDSKNKVIKSKINKIKSVYLYNSKLIKSKYPKGAKLTYNRAKTILLNDTKFNKNQVKYRGYYYANGWLFWSFSILDKYQTILSIDDFGGINFGGL